MTRQRKIIIEILILPVVFLTIFIIGSLKNVQAQYNADYEAIKKAVAEKDPQYCDQAEISKDNCLYLLASSVEDSSFCQLITDQEIKRQCLDLFIYRET